MELNKDGYLKIIENRSYDELNYTVTVLGKDYGLTAKQMNQVLTKLKVLGNWGPKDNPYRHMDDDNGGYEIYHYNSKEVNRSDKPAGLKKYTPIFNNIGMNKIKEKLSTIGIYPICDLILSRSNSSYDHSHIKDFKFMIRKRDDLSMSPIYIGYMSNLEKNTTLDRNCQPISKKDIDKISSLMRNSIKFSEDCMSTPDRYISPRIDIRDGESYNIIDEILYDKFINSFNILEDIDKYVKQNIDSYNKFIKSDPLQTSDNLI